jgi:hypothetical protein
MSLPLSTKLLLFVLAVIAAVILSASLMFLAIFASVGANEIITANGAIPSSITVPNPVPDVSALKVLVVLGQSFVGLLYSLSYSALIIAIVIGFCVFSVWLFKDEIGAAIDHMHNLKIVDKRKEER